MRFQPYPLGVAGVRKALFHSACVVLLAALAGGCSHTREYEFSSGAAFAPQPPTFLTGPMGVLLTNTPGFTAVAQVQNEPLGELGKPQTGQLLCRGNQVLYAPNPAKKPKKGFHDPGYSFVWNVAEHSGYVVSEALQGYAPISSSVRVTNVVRTAGALAQEKLAGHPCVPEKDTVETAEGSSVVFQVWRAKDLGGLPVQLSGSGGLPLTVTLSKIRSEPPPADLFVPPAEFTKYSSTEAMVDELARRERNLKNQGFIVPEIPDYSSPGPVRRPQ